MTIARIEDVAALAQAFGGDIKALETDVGSIAPNVRKLNTDAARAPLPTDDASQGYEAGSRWMFNGYEWLLSEDGWRPVGDITPERYGQPDRLQFIIGPAGDFATINDFLAFGDRVEARYIRNLAPPTSSIWRGIPTVVGVIAADFVMTEQVFLDGGDYSHIEIWGPSGINAAQNIHVPIRHSAITKRAPGSTEFYPVFHFKNVAAPRVRVRFALDASGGSSLVRGVHATNSTAMLDNGGVIGAPERGFVGYAGDYSLSSTSWDNSGTIGIRLANRASGLLTSATARGCGWQPGGGSGERAALHARGGTTINAHDADFSGSLGEGVILAGCLLYSENLNASGAATNGFRASASTAYLSGANVSGSGNYGLTATASTIHTDGLIADDCTASGIHAERGASVNALNASAQRCGTGIIVENAATVDAQGANLDDCSVGASVRYGSSLSLRSGFARRCASYPLDVSGESRVNASTLNASARLNTANGISVRSSRVNLSGADIRGAGGSADPADLTYWEGSQVNMTNAQGGWTGSTANAINGSRGIVWKQ